MAIGDFTLLEAADGLEALKRVEENLIDLIVLDVMMPKLDGWQTLREIRKSHRIPVIMLSARGEEYDKLLGFEMGVDDYVVKPFSPRELLARIKAVLARATTPVTDSDSKLIFDGLILDANARTVDREGERLSLTPKEYELLYFLMQNPRHAFSREQLLSAVWGYDFYGDDRTVDTHIKMLREHLGDYRNFIVTVWGVGYKFEPKN
ncbi:MAG: DNA-binding response regulator [Clostridiales bacterium 38-18]|nr:MAG: DNA-binding response regulator [Clostridiales bacterium 38-18]